jgi:hypothetical protein
MGFPRYGGIGGKGGNVNIVAKEGKWAVEFISAFVCDFSFCLLLDQTGNPAYYSLQS